MFLVCVIICNVLLHWGRNLTDWQGSESGIPVLPEAECHSLTQLVECSLLTWQLNPPELEYCPWQHHSPPQTKKEPEPSKGLDDESRWWTRRRLWSPGQIRFISERWSQVSGMRKVYFLFWISMSLDWRRCCWRCAHSWGSWSRGWKRRSALSHSRGWKRRSALAKRRFSSGFRRGNWMELVRGFKEEQTFQISNLSKQSFKENNVKSLNAKTWFQGSKTRFQIWSSKKSEQCKITRNHISLQRSLKNSKPRLLRMEDTEHDVPGNAKNIWMNTNDQSKTWHPSFFTDHRRLDTEGYPRKKFQP